MKEINSICIGSVWEKSDVTPFVIRNIFISNFNWITHFFSVTATDYNYFYFVIKLHNFVILQYCLSIIQSVNTQGLNVTEYVQYTLNIYFILRNL